jgi:hypothetical protein
VYEEHRVRQCNFTDWGSDVPAKGCEDMGGELGEGTVEEVVHVSGIIWLK